MIFTRKSIQGEPSEIRKNAGLPPISPQQHITLTPKELMQIIVIVVQREMDAPPPHEQTINSGIRENIPQVLLVGSRSDMILETSKKVWNSRWFKWFKEGFQELVVSYQRWLEELGEQMDQVEEQ